MFGSQPSWQALGNNCHCLMVVDYAKLEQEGFEASKFRDGGLTRIMARWTWFQRDSLVSTVGC